MIRHAGLIFVALAFTAPARASDFISDDPNSMYYGETWAAFDALDKTFAELSWATGGVLFPCEAWSPNWPGFTPAPPPPVIDYTPPPVPDPPPCDDCAPPPPCVMCNPPPSTPVPEPSTWLLLAVGMLATVCARLRLRRA